MDSSRSSSMGASRRRKSRTAFSDSRLLIRTAPPRRLIGSNGLARSAPGAGGMAPGVPRALPPTFPGWRMVRSPLSADHPPAGHVRPAQCGLDSNAWIRAKGPNRPCTRCLGGITEPGRHRRSPIAPREVPGVGATKPNAPPIRGARPLRVASVLSRDVGPYWQHSLPRRFGDRRQLRGMPSADAGSGEGRA